MNDTHSKMLMVQCYCMQRATDSCICLCATHNDCHALAVTLSEVLCLCIVVPLPLQAFEPLSVQLSDAVVPLQAFEPLSVQLSDASDPLQKDTHTLRFQLPQQHQHSQSQLGILAIASNGNLALPVLLGLLLSSQLNTPLTSEGGQG